MKKALNYKNQTRNFRRKIAALEHENAILNHQIEIADKSSREKTEIMHQSNEEHYKMYNKMLNHYSNELKSRVDSMFRMSINILITSFVVFLLHLSSVSVEPVNVASMMIISVSLELTRRNIFSTKNTRKSVICYYIANFFFTFLLLLNNIFPYIAIITTFIIWEISFKKQKSGKKI